MNEYWKKVKKTSKNGIKINEMSISEITTSYLCNCLLFNNPHYFIQELSIINQMDFYFIDVILKIIIYTAMSHSELP